MFFVFIFVFPFFSGLLQSSWEREFPKNTRPYCGPASYPSLESYTGHGIMSEEDAPASRESIEIIHTRILLVVIAIVPLYQIIIHRGSEKSTSQKSFIRFLSMPTHQHITELTHRHGDLSAPQPITFFLHAYM